jgi:hypothetical protein
MFLPLKECANEDVYAVGLQAKAMGVAVTQLKTPFTLVLTSDIFNHIMEHNGLQSYVHQAAQATTTDMQISLFSQIQEELKKVKILDSIKSQIKECFELSCLDTENLGKKSNHCILSIQRSTDYEDQDFVTPALTFSSDKFDQFIRAITQTIASAFTPASIADRLKRNIQSFTMGLIISRIPNYQSILEIDYQHQGKLNVQSYIGFIDPGKVVTRDQFSLSEEFLRVNTSQINEQREVSVFDLDQGRVLYKEFNKGSAQSSPNQAILEAGRYAKRVRELNEGNGVRGMFLYDGTDTRILSVRVQQTSKDQEKKTSRQNLAQELITFFKHHHYREFDSQMQAVSSRMTQDPSPENIKEALELSLVIMNLEHKK